MNDFSFMGSLAKLQKAAISFIASVCLSVYLLVRPSARMELLGCHGMDFHDI
jgi:hypothetical protein